MCPRGHIRALLKREYVRTNMSAHIFVHYNVCGLYWNNERIYAKHVQADQLSGIVSQLGNATERTEFADSLDKVPWTVNHCIVPCVSWEPISSLELQLSTHHLLKVLLILVLLSRSCFTIEEWHPTPISESQGVVYLYRFPYQLTPPPKLNPQILA